MSRSDAAFGNNHVFNQTIFDTTRVYWTGAVLDAKMLANGKLFRQIESRAYNPNYTFTTTTEEFSLGEVAAPIIVFGDMQAGTVERDRVEYFFGESRAPGTSFSRKLIQVIENERLPSELGWTKKTEPVTLENITRVANIIRNATSLFTPGGSAPHSARRRDLHSGLGL